MAYKPDCLAKLDALWICYSPLNQLGHYYREGEVEDCRTRWRQLLDCARGKDSAHPDQQESEQKAAAPPMAHIWQIRTREEATAAWEKEFGHLWADDDADESRQ
eukprot:jgi/Chlat1/5591/Chrsp369S00857